MISHAVFITCCHLFLVANSTFVEDLEPLFRNKHCIEASVISLSSDRKESIMLDSENFTEQETLVNNTLKSDKSITSKLNELAQYNNIDYIYKLLSEDGPPHARVFTIKLILGDESYEGTGHSLKKAQQAAAALALDNTFYKHPLEKIKDEEKPQTPTVILNNIAMKLGIAVSYYLLNGKEEQTIHSYGAYDEAYGKAKSHYQKINASTSNPLRVAVEEFQTSGPFTVKVNVGELVFRGIGHTIQSARHDAATKALKHMEKEALFKDSVCSKDESVGECKQKKESLKSPITRIYESGQIHNLPVEFTVISESGKPHKKIFITQCRLGIFITEGEGNSKKESKKIAAEKMLEYLQYLPELYSENAIVSGMTNEKKKRNKKKKVIKDNSNNIIETVSQMASSLWNDGDGDNILPKEKKKDDSSSSQSKRPNSRNRVTSAKDKILEIGNKLNIAIEFTDLSKNGDEFYTLVSLGLKPPHVCLGKDVQREISHEKAASYAILFLQKSGIFEKAGLGDYDQSYGFEDYDFEKEVVHKPFEEESQ